MWRLGLASAFGFAVLAGNLSMRTVPPSSTSFRFAIAAEKGVPAGSEVFGASVADEDSPPQPASPAFRIRLDSPARRTAVGASLHGALLRAGPGSGLRAMRKIFEIFEPQATSGGVTGLSPQDSLPFSATVDGSGGTSGVWSARIRVASGGELVLVLDGSRHTGEIRRSGNQRSLELLRALLGIFVPRK